MWDCIKSEGLHLGTCSDRFLFGSCCYHNTTYNDIDVQRLNSSTTSSPSNESAESQKIPTITLNGSMESITSTDSYLQQQTTPSPTAQQTSETSTLAFLQSTSSLSEHLMPLVNLNQPSTPSFHNGSMSESEQSWHSNQANHDPNRTKPPVPSIPEDSTVWSSSSSGDLTTVTQTTIKKHMTPSSYARPTISNPTTVSSSLNGTSDYLNSDLQTTTASSSTNLTKQQPLGQMNSSLSQHQVEPHSTQTSVYNNQPIYSSNQHQPIRPSGQSSSWLSRPASLLANAFFHSFKPFPYLSPNRQRPTYRPFMNGGYRPMHYRPSMLANQRPQTSYSNNNGISNQQMLLSQPTSDATIVSSSETSFTSLQNDSSTGHSSISTPSVGNLTVQNENSDHHIVNPASSMTNRHRPMDKTPYGDSLSLIQKQNHYDLINGTSVNGPSQGEQEAANDRNSTGLSTNSPSSRPSIYHKPHPTSYDSSPPVSLGSLDQSQSMFDDHSNQTVSVSYQIPEKPSTSDLVQQYNQNGLLAPVVDTTYGLNYSAKPVSLLDGHANENHTAYGYPKYPLIAGLSSTSASQQQHPNLVSDPHFSTLGPIDEIHGLSVDQPHNSSANSSSLINYESANGQMEGEYPGSVVEPTSTQGDSIVTNPHLERPSSSLSMSLYPQTTTVVGSNFSSGIFSTTEPAQVESSSMSPNRDSVVSAALPPAPSRISSSLAASGDGKRGPSVVGASNKEVACGVTALYPQTKVVGGKNAAFGAWPWQVSVRKVSFFGFSSTHRCGGAVISSEWIATAGHCVEDLALQSIRIRVGEYDFSSVSEPFPYIERAARRKVVHPKYNFYTYENDLALVQLDQPIQFPPHIAPICLPPDNIDLLGRNATVTGWGRLNEGGTLPTILQEVRVPIVSNDKCKDMFLSAGRPEYIPDIFLCAGYEEGGRDSCQGDSGGPLQVKGDDGKWFLAGIISWGIGCAEQNLPGVCTRISRFKLWIQSTMSSSA